MIESSIVIPTKNGGGIFKKVLNRVLNQEVSFPYEVVIIDSGSKDDTVSYIKQKMKSFNNIVFKEIHSSEFGHGKTRNLGASMSKGKFIIFITQDALPYNNKWLSEMVKPFSESQEIVGVFGKHLAYPDCDIFEKHNLDVHFNNFGKNIVTYKLDDKDRYASDEGYRHLLCFYSDNCSAMRKSIWEVIPYDDVDFAEDQLWAKKIIENGYTKAYNSNAVVYHSHTYSFLEGMMRSYDDHKGLYKIYNYVPVKSFYLLPNKIIKHVASDYRFLINLNISNKKVIYWLFFSMKKNIGKYIGSYFGSKSHLKFIDTIFSRELLLRKK